MRKYHVKIYFKLICIILLLACRGKANQVQQEINVKDSILQCPMTKLPIASWNINIEYEEPYFISDNQWVENIYNTKERGDSILSFYFILDKGNNSQYHSFLLNIVRDCCGYSKLMNIDDRGHILSELLLREFKYLEEESGNEGEFYIAKDMKIYLYKAVREYKTNENEVDNNVIEEVEIILEDKKLQNIYQVKPDGKIEKIESSFTGNGSTSWMYTVPSGFIFCFGYKSGLI